MIVMDIIQAPSPRAFLLRAGYTPAIRPEGLPEAIAMFSSGMEGILCPIPLSPRQAEEVAEFLLAIPLAAISYSYRPN